MEGLFFGILPYFISKKFTFIGVQLSPIYWSLQFISFNILIPDYSQSFVPLVNLS